MAQLDKLETTLDDMLNKKAPFKIPEDGRKTLAGALWWLALIFGVLQLWSAWALWNVAHIADPLVDYANSISAAYGVGPVVNSLGFFYYLALAVIAAVGIVSLLAAPGLKAMKKSGWNLLFYAMLVNVAYGVVILFEHYGGFGDMLAAFVSSLIGAYLLFQVRSQFMKSHAVSKKS